MTTVDTPVMKDAPALRIDTEYLIVPILRAGLGMSPAVQEVLPHHRVCLVGLRRNEVTLQPDVYLDGLPESLEGVHVVVCDPMLATGGSLDCVLEMLRGRGAGEITVLCLIAARPGVEFVLSQVTPTSRSSPPRLTKNSTTLATSARASATPAIDSLDRRRADLEPDVLVPEVGVLGDEVAEELGARGVVEDDDLDAEFSEPVVAAVEVLALADHDRADVELTHEPRAVPAR